ncbi:MAG: 16S rRNA (cytosine(967)-C(5))-methyltransferase RsmB [Gammaproteobacteria bacterium]|nr:16S rRNA (cytosine(967)-C(5))-methyltransferase RsmB [Gammaproteobacteria bacterium]
MVYDLAKIRHRPPANSNIHPRALAARILKQVVSGRSLTELLPEVDAIESSKDRALVKELCFGTCRWWWQLDDVVARLVARPLKEKDQDIHALMLMGLYQLQYTRVPAHAAVADTVEATRKLHKKWATGMVNGVLRSFMRQRDELMASTGKSSAAHFAFPEWLLTRLQQAWPEHWKQIVKAENERPPMALRVNLSKTTLPDYLQQLGQRGITARPIKGVKGGLLLDRAQDVATLPGFSEGFASVQDGGAQFAAWLLDPKPGERILDACAAPGGKSGHLLELAPGIKLTAVDVAEPRLARVAENMERLGVEARLLVGDMTQPKGDWADAPYDRILLDVPCSATGVIRRHPDIKLLRRDGDIPALARTQQQILQSLWSLLKPGGRLLYVTCSLLPEENEQQINHFIKERQDVAEVAFDGDWGEARSHGRQILPGESNMDGFYYACLEKRGGKEKARSDKPVTKKRAVAKKVVKKRVAAKKKPVEKKPATKKTTAASVWKKRAPGKQSTGKKSQEKDK